MSDNIYCTPEIKRDSFINRCLGCGVDMGDTNPRQFCCKSYCPELEPKLKKQRIIISHQKPRTTGLIVIKDNNRIVGCFDSILCSILDRTDVQLVRLAICDEMLELKKEINSINRYKINNKETAHFKKLINIHNIRMKTNYIKCQKRYAVLNHLYNYLRSMVGYCEYEDQDICDCTECPQCLYRKHMSQKLTWKNDFDEKEAKEF